MEQNRRIYELAAQGQNAQEIKNVLNVEFGKHSHTISNIYIYVKNYKLGIPLEAQKEKPGPKRDEQLVIRIHQVLEKEPFASTRYIADMLNENHITIWRYLVEEMHYVFKHTNWVPHFFDAISKKKERRDQAETL